MKNIAFFNKHFLSYIKQQCKIASAEHMADVDLVLNADKDSSKFGDISCNAAMVLARVTGKNPRQLAAEILAAVNEERQNDNVFRMIEKIEIAGPGFLNITFTKNAWREVAHELLTEKSKVFTGVDHQQRYLLEFVSANPTGPLHLGHGRNGIIGDVLARILRFLGHQVHTEFYINDAGNQMGILGQSLKVRCLQLIGQQADVPAEGYHGEYLIDLAKQCIGEFGQAVIERDLPFFTDYAMRYLLTTQQRDLRAYGIQFDSWFSEKTLHESGQVLATIETLKDRDLVYEDGGALWFKSTQFGDDKDRVIRKTTGELTYIAADIAYHKQKFERGFDILIDILGQDHHGYVKRLKATMQALGFNPDHLDVILYQLVTIKENDVAVRMSKRAGTFTKLSDVVEAVGPDVARFFYLNRKADAHLEFDLTTALKTTDENPVYYIHYAYVRTLSVLAKARQDEQFKMVFDNREASQNSSLEYLSDADITLLKKILSLHGLLRTIAATYQMHMLATYTWELACAFHSYYAVNRVLDHENSEVSRMRLLMVIMVRDALDLCLDLLGVSKPERM